MEFLQTMAFVFEGAVRAAVMTGTACALAGLFLFFMWLYRDPFR